MEITKHECVIKRNGVTVATGTNKGSLLYISVMIEDECRIVADDIEL